MFSLDSSQFICWVLPGQVEGVQWKEAFGDHQRKTRQAEKTHSSVRINQELSLKTHLAAFTIDSNAAVCVYFIRFC